MVVVIEIKFSREIERKNIPEFFFSASLAADITRRPRRVHPAGVLTWCGCCEGGTVSASPLCRGGLVTVGGSCTSNKLSVSIEKKKKQI